MVGLAAVLALATSAPAQAMPSAQGDEPAACGEQDRAPDPRCNESLDGREAPRPSPARQLGTIALAPPRAVARVVLLPVEQTGAVLERHAVFPWLEAITTSDDGKIGIRPEVEYASGFAPTFGVHAFDKRLPRPGAEVSARFKTGGADIMHGELAVRGASPLNLIVGTLWDRRNDRLFAGIGSPAPGTRPIEARYRADIYRAEALWFTRGGGPLRLVARAGVEARDYVIGEVRGGPPIADAYPELAQAQGFGTDRSLLYQRLRFLVDLRPDGRDASGVELGFEGGLTQGIAADPSRHARVGADAVAQLGGIDRALVLRFVAAAVEPLGPSPVPFDELISPSGVAGLRGLPDGLLRDRSGLVGTAEYRWLISSAIDATLFVDEGAVAGRWFSGLALQDFQTSVGGGIRLYGHGRARYWEESVERTIQVAYAPSRGFRLLLSAALF